MNYPIFPTILVLFYVSIQIAVCTLTLTRSNAISVSKKSRGKSQISNEMLVGGLYHNPPQLEQKETGYSQSEIGILFKGEIMKQRFRRNAKPTPDNHRKRKRKNRRKPPLGLIESGIVKEKSSVYFNFKHRSSSSARKKVVSTQSREPNSMLCPVWPTDPKVIVNCSNGRRVRSRCAVRCAPGFRLADGNRRNRKCKPSIRGTKKSTTTTTTGDAFWSGRDENFKCGTRKLSLPSWTNIPFSICRCQAAVPVCNPLPLPPNGNWKCSSPKNAQYSKSCSMVCNEGFRAVGTSMRQCMFAGNWSDANATCKGLPKSKPRAFVRHQVLNCGDVYSLRTYRHRDDLFLAAGDKTGNLIRIYRWDGSRFASPPYQTIRHSHPRSIEVILRNGNKKLYVGNQAKTTFYSSNREGKFQKPMTSRNLNLTSSKRRRNIDDVDYIPLNDEIYRCRGRNRRGRSVVLVQKLSKRRTGKREVFKRVMRRKLKSGESIYRCSMAVAGKKLHTIVTTNSRERGHVGRIIIGVHHKGRMKIIDILKERDFRKLSDTSGFEDTEHNQYIVAAQTTLNGECFVYKRAWQQSHATG